MKLVVRPNWRSLTASKRFAERMVHPSGRWIIDWQICYVEIRQTPPLPDFPRFLPQFLPRPAIRYLIMSGQQSRVCDNGDQYDQVNRNLYKTDIEQVGRRSAGATAQGGQGTPVSSREFSGISGYQLRKGAQVGEHSVANKLPVNRKIQLRQRSTDRP